MFCGTSGGITRSQSGQIGYESSEERLDLMKACLLRVKRLEVYVLWALDSVNIKDVRTWLKIWFNDLNYLGI